MPRMALNIIKHPGNKCWLCILRSFLMRILYWHVFLHHTITRSPPTYGVLDHLVGIYWALLGLSWVRLWGRLDNCVMNVWIKCMCAKLSEAKQAHIHPIIHGNALFCKLWIQTLANLHMNPCFIVLENVVLSQEDTKRAQCLHSLDNEVLIVSLVPVAAAISVSAAHIFKNVWIHVPTARYKPVTPTIALRWCKI